MSVKNMLGQTGRDSDNKEAAQEELRRAFDRFSSASEKLEQRYSSLVEEVHELRIRLAEKEEEVKRAEKLATLGETAAALAHEVRNPLGAIKLFISLLKDDVRDKPESIKILDQIDRSVSVLDGVVSNILQFAKDGELQRTPANIHSLIKEQGIHFSRLLRMGEQGIVFDLKGNPYAEVNEQGIRQILYNILLNACHVTKYRGVIQIQTSGGDQGLEKVGSECIEIVISDNGPGIPESLLNKIFEPFVTGRHEGTGLGLAIVKKIVHQHGGIVTASNNGGAKFTIRLPRRKGGTLLNN